MNTIHSVKAVTHHGNFREVRRNVVPEIITTKVMLDIIQNTAYYGFMDNAKIAAELATELYATGRAEYGWTTFIAND